MPGVCGVNNLSEPGEGYASVRVCVLVGGGVLDVSVGVNITCLIPAHRDGTV